MRLLSHRNINLHSKSTEGGLIHIPAGSSKVVPEDVTEHPGFKILKKAGHIVVLQDEPEQVDDADIGDGKEKEDDNVDERSQQDQVENPVEKAKRAILASGKGKDNQQADKPKADK